MEWLMQIRAQPSEWQSAHWSTCIEQRVPGEVESRVFFNEEIVKLGRKHEDIPTWADFLDLDDYVSDGGQP
jgi:Domain of unknown function (DUF5069)